jgi:hypothetical protein
MIETLKFLADIDFVPFPGVNGVFPPKYFMDELLLNGTEFLKVEEGIYHFESYVAASPTIVFSRNGRILDRFIYPQSGERSCMAYVNCVHPYSYYHYLEDRLHRNDVASLDDMLQKWRNGIGGKPISSTPIYRYYHDVNREYLTIGRFLEYGVVMLDFKILYGARTVERVEELAEEVEEEMYQLAKKAEAEADKSDSDEVVWTFKGKPLDLTNFGQR